jgi:hypothetical protein
MCLADAASNRQVSSPGPSQAELSFNIFLNKMQETDTSYTTKTPLTRAEGVVAIWSPKSVPACSQAPSSGPSRHCSFAPRNQAAHNLNLCREGSKAHMPIIFHTPQSAMLLHGR